MSWTRPAAAATPDAPAIYERIRSESSRGAVSNLWLTLGADAAALESAYSHYRTLMADPAPLTAAQAELVVLVVSATNGCGYCVAHHGPRLSKALGDDALARAVARDYREANLKAQDRVLLDYAVALTCEPSERKLEDVERIREYGFDDRAIVRATAIVGYYNHINRVVSALGVELEPGVQPWEFGSQK